MQAITSFSFHKIKAIECIRQYYPVSVSSSSPHLSGMHPDPDQKYPKFISAKLKTVVCSSEDDSADIFFSRRVGKINPIFIVIMMIKYVRSSCISTKYILHMYAYDDDIHIE